MNNSQVRKADLSELDQIYLMGADVWADDTEAKYLEACRSSSKYTRGTWYVLADENGKLTCSLIVYKFGPDQFGIGSIATMLSERKQGHASKLIAGVLEAIAQESSKATVFLYSDIEPKFYERFGFVRLPPIAQRYLKTTCMVRSADIDKFISDKTTTPEYF